MLLLLLLPSFSLSLKVLSTVRDATSFTPNSGAELLRSSLAGRDTVTICVRVNVFQFIQKSESRDYPEQDILLLGSRTLLHSSSMTNKNPAYRGRAGEKWQNGDILVGNMFGVLEKVDWRPGTWNSFCFNLAVREKTMTIWFNGRVLQKHNYDSYHYNIAGNIKLLGWLQNNTYSFSLFGAVTDIHIWTRSLVQVEVEQWSRCEVGAGGNLLDWNTAQWRAVGLQEEEMGKEEVCRERGQNHMLMIFQAKETFQIMTFFSRSSILRLAKEKFALCS